MQRYHRIVPQVDSVSYCSTSTRSYPQTYSLESAAHLRLYSTNTILVAAVSISTFTSACAREAVAFTNTVSSSVAYLQRYGHCDPAAASWSLSS